MELRRGYITPAGQAVDEDTQDGYILHQLKQVDLMNIQEGLELLQAKYQVGVDAHNRECSPRQCAQYAEPKDGLTCAEDRMFLYDQLAKINHMLFLIQGEGL